MSGPQMKSRVCEALGCSNTSTSQSGIAFHQFPHDSKRSSAWIKNIQMKPSSRKEKYLCSDHFEDRCFPSSLKNRIRQLSVPTLQLKDPATELNRNSHKELVCSDQDAESHEQTLLLTTSPESNDDANEDPINNPLNSFSFGLVEDPNLEEEEKRKAKQYLLKIILPMIEGNISDEVFSQTCLKLSIKDYDELFLERSICNICCNPICFNYMPVVKRENDSTQETNNQAWRQCFCTAQCFESSNHLKSQFSSLLFKMKEKNGVSHKQFEESEDSFIKSEDDAEEENARKTKRDVLKIVLFMIEGNISDEEFTENCLKLSVRDYDELVEERRVYDMCGFPICLNYVPKMVPCGSDKTSEETKPWRQYFCTSECSESSKLLRSQLSSLLLNIKDMNPVQHKQRLLEYTMNYL